jgi:hypothetical protein
VAFLVPLDNLADDANGHLLKATQIEKKADEHRIAAGLILIEARKRVDGGEFAEGWEKWCEKIKRSQGDIRKVMRIAGHKEPQVALDAERAATAARVAGIREARVQADVRAVVDPAETDVRRLVAQYMVQLGVTIEQMVEYFNE